MQVVTVQMVTVQMVTVQVVIVTVPFLLWEPVLEVYVLQGGFGQCLAQTDLSFLPSGQSCALAEQSVGQIWIIGL